MRLNARRIWLLLLPPLAAVVMAIAPEADPGAEDQDAVGALVFGTVAVLADLALIAGMALRRVVAR